MERAAESTRQSYRHVGTLSHCTFGLHSFLLRESYHSKIKGQVTADSAHAELSHKCQQPQVSKLPQAD